MALSREAAKQALIAFQRFGLGAKPGGAARIGGDAKAAIRAEVQTRDIALINNPDLPSYVRACADSQKEFERAEGLRQLELNARFDKHMAPEIGFVERLVVFWTNHFAMNVNKHETVRGTIGQWERDVIRAHVLGRFADMLHAAIEHPAMLNYLDNADSIGPNSPRGKQTGLGFNENLAREVLELHTIGSGSGYSEQDVTALAKILTGWSYVRGWEVDYGVNGGNAHNRGQFIYRDNCHEPGPITLMGKTYPAVGKQQMKLVLNHLAVHPATAEHIAFKLVRHFITDLPTPAMVNPLTRTFLHTGGNLKALALALLDLPEAWSTPLAKFRTPYEQTVAQYRALGVRYPDDQFWVMAEPLRTLHQIPWEAPSPEGFSDETPTWLNPDAMRVRLDVAQITSWICIGKYEGNAVQLADRLFDAALSPATRQAVAAMGRTNGALTILLTSPEFQRR